ncbi:alpha-L-arabinofuranosidase II [Lindgomyces ingoldianus]|uniref:Alpha-L-arabinofuranosidase II n=1 Tax=Lindgomyces ingoldianus TaxID=673940 RepID=A0ACB6QFU5_9PLEO|nr:alpha-L-arabinofuranosidase II [Lindgomyces ingoldianus]KAF2465370.1 alpha-L-arabinofuranosidase II [Lindgomyces ingoldianus]
MFPDQDQAQMQGGGGGIGQMQGAMGHLPYNDHVLTITNATTPDPYVICEGGIYYMTFTAGDRVEIWSADSLFEFEKRAKKDVIWRPPPNTPYSGDLWAPELHSLYGRWYVYFAADDPAHGNKSHRMYVLAGPPSDQSPLNPQAWNFEGRLQGIPEDQWAIDGTVISLHGGLCFVYSGWPLGENSSESKQEIFIIEMESPTCCTGTPVRISTPDHPWEYSGKSGINEGPQFLSSPDGRWTGIVYSCAGSWTHEYKMNILHFVGGNPLEVASWRKSGQPLLMARRDDAPPYGPGHGNFVVVNGPAGQEVWGVFHATDKKTGWEGRKARIMRVGWGEGGPFMGSGECGNCSNDVNHFLYGSGSAGGGGGGGGGGGNGAGGGLKGLKGLMGQAKGLVNKIFK